MVGKIHNQTRRNLFFLTNSINTLNFGRSLNLCENFFVLSLLCMLHLKQNNLTVKMDEKHKIIIMIKLLKTAGLSRTHYSEQKYSALILMILKS